MSWIRHSVWDAKRSMKSISRRCSLVLGSLKAIIPPVQTSAGIDHQRRERGRVGSLLRDRGDTAVTEYPLYSDVICALCLVMNQESVPTPPGLSLLGVLLSWDLRNLGWICLWFGGFGSTNCATCVVVNNLFIDKNQLKGDRIDLFQMFCFQLAATQQFDGSLSPL